MKASIKGAIWSGLGFPGVGQIMLGRQWEGVAFVLMTSVAILAILYSAVQRIPSVLEKLVPEMERGTLTLAMIFKETHRITAVGGTALEQFSLWVILFCWVLSLARAYLAGRKMEEESASKNL
jgi:hypothetical protein